VNGAVQVICGPSSGPISTYPGINCNTAGAIQFAEHTNATGVRTFSVNWTAPATAVGTVRFNLAGNAANGDNLNTGDHIYTQVYKVDPASTGPDLSVKAYTLVDRGGFSVITDGSGDLNVGFSRIQPASGNTTPAGVAVYGLRQNNVVVAETGVPASPLLTSGRIFAIVNPGIVNTGLAIANPQTQTATVSFVFTDQNGVDTPGTGTVVLGPGQQTAKFLNESPINIPVNPSTGQFNGTVTFTSTVPVSVIALRGSYNERTPTPDFLISTLPVTDLSAAPATGSVYLSQFADGGGWTTQVLLVNPTATTLTGTITFIAGGGTPATVKVGGQTGSTFNYTVARQSSFRIATDGSPAATSIGTVRVTPSAGGSAPTSLAVFAYKPAGITVSEAGVPGIQGSVFRMYAEETAAGGINAIQTGVAISNLSASPITVNLELTNLDGTPNGSPTPVQIPGNGQVAKFIHEAFPSLAFPFKGVLRISGGASEGLSVVGLRTRTNERGDFLMTTTPPSNEGTPSSTAELDFPHLVNGGGYTTQFILFSGTAGQASSGNLKFLKQDGTAMSLTVN
jgi:hypothetical protein